MFFKFTRLFPIIDLPYKFIPGFHGILEKKTKTKTKIIHNQRGISINFNINYNSVNFGNQMSHEIHHNITGK